VRSLVDCGECRTQGCLEGHCRNAKPPKTNPAKEQQAVQRLMDLARAFRHADTVDYDATYKELQNACYAALVDHEKQIIKELAEKSWVMPRMLPTAEENYSDHTPELDAYTEAVTASSKAEAELSAAIAASKGSA